MNPTDLPPLLHRLATAGLTLRRVDCDRIEVAGDGLTDELRQQIREAKPLLLQTMPQPRQPLQSPRVANVKDLPSDWQTDPRFVYIGRANPRLGLQASPFANPFRIDKDRDREQAIAKFREYLASRPDLQAKARAELCGKVLVCYCSPSGCHGDILAGLFAACPHCGSTDLASGKEYRWCLDCEAKLGPAEPLLGDDTADEREAIQTEHLLDGDGSLAETMRWFERRDRWREAEAQGVLSQRVLAGHNERIAPGGSDLRRF